MEREKKTSSFIVDPLAASDLDFSGGKHVKLDYGTPEQQFLNFIEQGTRLASHFGRFHNPLPSQLDGQWLKNLLQTVNPNTLLHGNTALSTLIKEKPRNLELIKVLLDDERTDPTMLREYTTVEKALINCLTTRAASSSRCGDEEKRELVQLIHLFLNNRNTPAAYFITTISKSDDKIRPELETIAADHPRILLYRNIRNLKSDEEAADFFHRLMQDNHQFDEKLRKGLKYVNGYLDWYLDIAKEQKQLRTQEMLASQFGRTNREGKETREELVQQGREPREKRLKGEKDIESVDLPLPKDIWNTIFAHRRQKELCSGGGSDFDRGINNYPALFYVTFKMGLPYRSESGKLYTKPDLCTQLAAFLTMADLSHPEDLSSRMSKKLHKLLKLAEELGIETRGVKYKDIGKRIADVMTFLQ